MHQDKFVSQRCQVLQNFTGIHSPKAQEGISGGS